MMPVLVVLSILITVYSVSRPGALKGVKYFLIPNFENFSWMTVVTAMGQMFYSLSIAMGILITFGSYMDDLYIRQWSISQCRKTSQKKPAIMAIAIDVYYDSKSI